MNVQAAFAVITNLALVAIAVLIFASIVARVAIYAWTTVKQTWTERRPKRKRRRPSGQEVGGA